MIGIGVIGYGYWGPNMVRNFAEVAGSRVVAVCDIRPDRAGLVKKRYPAIRTIDDPQRLISDPEIDAVVIATPVSSHFDLAMQTLKAGKHVLVEKPVTATADQARSLIEEADRRRLVLMVDHTFIYTGAVRKINDLINTGELGELYYYDSVRVNLGLFQHDVSVLWDLAVHDLSIMDYLISSRPVAVSATGISHITGEPQDVAYLTIFFDNSLIAHIHVNWLAPVKIRRTLIGGSRKMIVYDDLEPSEKIKVYDKGITLSENSTGSQAAQNRNQPGNHPENVYRMLVGYRTGDMWAPQIDSAEALRSEATHFVSCIEGSESPLTDGKAGLQVVKILEAASKSMLEHGKPVELSDATREVFAL